MPAPAATIPSFFGRDTEIKQFVRMLEGRAGGRIGFSGIGGIGKTALLRQLAAEAHRLQVTDYIATIDLTAAQVTPDTPARPITTELDLLCAVITALEATGKTTKRRWLHTTDALATAKRLRDALLAQPAQVLVQPQLNVEASNQSSVGGIRVDIPVTTRGVTVTIEQLRTALVHAIKLELPYMVRPIPGNSSLLPRRLVVLFVDTLERTSRAVEQALRDLAGALPENLLLICAGRDEDCQGLAARAALLPAALPALEPPAIAAWLSKYNIYDQAMHTAIATLTAGIPLLISLAIAQITAAQGHALTAADFQLPGPVTREIATHYLLEGYLNRLEHGSADEHQIRDLILYGCVLRRFEPIESVRAIGAMAGDAGATIRLLEQRGFLVNRQMHEVLQHAARAYLQAEEPEHYEALVAATVRYYQARGPAYAADLFHAQLLQGLGEAGALLEAYVAERLTAGDIAGAAELVAVAQAAAPDPQLRWAIALAKADLANAEGATALAEQRLLDILNMPARPAWVDAALQQRMSHIPALQHVPVFQIWLIEQQAPDPAQLAALFKLGSAVRAQYNWRLAQQIYQLALHIAEALDDRSGQAAALRGLGEVARLRDNLPAAEQHFTAALALFKALDDRFGQAYALRGLGDIARLRAEPGQAHRYATQSLTLAQNIEALGLQYHAWDLLRRIAEGQGDLNEAARCRVEAEYVYAEIHKRR